ncbi:MAG: CopD family protein [Acidobacteriota bacterium]|nr:CopD family protein [Acidobacteriota bacterium]MDQ7087647.1 CopD family protein [Acidobacteriota bacterium]
MELGILLLLHALASAVWVGGMFFSMIALRPAAATLADPAVRNRLWLTALSRFFTWTWIAVIVLLATGFRMILAFYGGMKGLALHINLMMTLGLLMALIFAYLFFVPFGRFRRAADASDPAEADRALRQIRLLVMVNLHLGFLAVILGAGGRHMF